MFELQARVYNQSEKLKLKYYVDKNIISKKLNYTLRNFSSMTLDIHVIRFYFINPHIKWREPGDFFNNFLISFHH